MQIIFVLQLMMTSSIDYCWVHRSLLDIIDGCLSVCKQLILYVHAKCAMVGAVAFISLVSRVGGDESLLRDPALLNV